MIMIKTLARTDSSLTITCYMVLLMTPLALIPASFVWTWPVGIEWLWLVACAVGGDRPAVFEIDDRRFELTVGDWREPLGCWRQRQRGRILPGRIRRHEVAFYASHGHDARGADEPYAFRYLFRYSLPLATGARRLQLPDEPRIRLFAMAVASGGPGTVYPVAPIYD